MQSLTGMLQDTKTRRALQAYIASEWGAKLSLTGDINHDIAQIQQVYDEAVIFIIGKKTRPRTC